MRAASRETLVKLRERRESVLGASASAEALNELAADLHAVADLLNEQPRLRRTLGDSSAAADSRAGLASNVLNGKIGAAALEIAVEAVRGRWSSPWDLPDALETVADDTLLAVAEREGALSTVEDELFGFERLLDREPKLSTYLDEESVAAERRIGLLDSLIGGKVNPTTRALLEHAVASRRKHVLSSAVGVLLDQAADLGHRSLARVVSAVELSPQQQDRLASALSDLYGRSISIRTAIDPAIRGGLIVHIGDEVIDGSVAARLIDVRSALAS